MHLRIEILYMRDKCSKTLLNKYYFKDCRMCLKSALRV